MKPKVRNPNTMEDLYFEELRDLHHAEVQLLEALPAMAKATSAGKLKQALLDDHALTKIHIRQLEHIFARLGQDPEGHACKAMDGLLREGRDLIDAQPDHRVLDAGLLVTAQKAQHYEMAGYGSALAFAEALGREDEAQALKRLLYEEKTADAALTEIASTVINPSVPLEDSTRPRQVNARRTISHIDLSKEEEQ